MSRDQASPPDPDQPATSRVSGYTPPASIQLRECELVVLAGPDKGKTFRLNCPLIRIGKDKKNEVVLTDPSVSRLHASLQDQEDGCFLRDLGSTNGVVLNGARVKQAYLVAGMEIVLGDSTLRFQPLHTTVKVSPSTHHSFHGLIGHSVEMRTLFAFLERFSPTDLSVMLLGETGTGKELIAQAVHKASRRAKKNYMVFDCSATEATLVGAALFGHTRGAFTGATESRAGAFASANGGTLFIDEIGELPLDLQPKLLGALERREVTPIGSDRAIPVDVRIVCGTHRDLKTMVAEGRFRQDLYYRLSGVALQIPRLRDRIPDIVPLALHFLGASATPERLTATAMAILNAYHWPGNVRELRTAMARAIALAGDGVVDAAHLLLDEFQSVVAEPAPMASAAPEVKTLDDLERTAIEEALRLTRGNRVEASKMLGITDRTLRRKLRIYSGKDEK
jgi:DNA-binding NtrC family response regulator